MSFDKSIFLIITKITAWNESLNFPPALPLELVYTLPPGKAIILN